MSGIVPILRDLYVRFLIWLGAEPPEGYEGFSPSPPVTGPQEYTVKEDETIFAVARRFGVHYDLIAQANGIEDYNSVKPGQTLIIPPPDWTPDSGPLTEPEVEAQPEPEEPSSEPTEPLEPFPPQEPWEETEPIADEWEAGEEFELPSLEPEPVEETESPLEPGEPEWLMAAAPLSNQGTAVSDEDIRAEELSDLANIEWLDTGEPLEAFAAEVEADIEPTVQELMPDFEAEAPPVPTEEPEPAIETETVSEEAMPPISESEGIFRYTVQRGDTLNAIARRYGLTVKDLLEANDIADASRIFPDQKLIIPGYSLPKPEPEPEAELPPPPIEDSEHFIYTIASGDTLSAISKRYGITLRELIEANNIEDPNLIRAGQKLIIPGVMKPSEPPKAPEPEPELFFEPESPVQPEPTFMAEPEPVKQPETKPSPRIDTGMDFLPIGPPAAVRAMYVSYFAVGHAESRQRIFELLDTTEFNAVVIDSKGDHGWISYPTQIPLAQEIGAARPTAKDFGSLLAQFKARGIYTIARIVTFKDNLLAKSHPELAVKTNTGTIWQDRDKLGWSDPFYRPVWDYNIQIAVEAARMGFDEIQFDYLRFPTPSQAGVPHFSQEINKETRVAAITGFLSAARGQLNPLGVKVAADIFGYTCWREDDAVIGQNIDRMGQYLDVLCPMLYPSTFGNGIPGYKNAIAHPYEIVYHSASRAVNRLKPLGCEVRPWIQDFPDYRFDKRVYGKAEIQAQIKGCFDSGSTGFMVWDPRVEYTDGAYAPVRELA